MPKVGKNSKAKITSFVKEFGEDVFSTDGSVLLCKICEKSVNFEKKYFISQHLGTAKHQAAYQKKSGGSKKATLLSNFTEASSKKSQFSMDLCEVLIEAGIPLWKLTNDSLRTFLEKYTKETIPTESTLRKNYLDPCYDATMKRIQHHVQGKKLWVSIDETTDAIGRYVANVVIGTMEPNNPSKVFLLTCQQLEKTNGSTIAQVFTQSMHLLWPEGVQHEEILLFVTDAAPYMKKAFKALSVLFPSMIHLTCLAHGLHRVAEEIRSLYPDVDRLISNVKKVFLKAPSRVQIFKEIAPHITLPPQPVLTRWGTWLSAALYYSENFTVVKEIVNKLSDHDATSIQIAKQLLDHKSLQNDLCPFF